ncbi:hypothetical protein [Caballeronia sp. BR00000012568055]|uniref:hypothetical protein n=1 Tax=Caballeronia sp. BR00000012568055 TaxID=2918761 RepID=UPI0023F651E4|nr:hypothetical protein [Caballeronia sp. BR00000012568055]
MSTLSEDCKNTLYRLRIKTRVEQFVFVMAEDREHAARRVRAALSILHEIPLHEARVHDLDSYSELICFGVSADRDLRIFEAESKRGKVNAWITSPLFLTSDATLLGKWAELHASLRDDVTTSATPTRASSPPSTLRAFAPYRPDVTASR